MKTFLVTGGCGFIGTHVVQMLMDRGDAVRVLDDLSTGKREKLVPGASLILGDVADAATVRAAMDGVDGCFHLAAVASVAKYHDDLLHCTRVNHVGTLTIMAEAAARGVPVVYASSAAAYGNYDGVVVTEDTPPRPISGYGADKLSGEWHARALCATSGARIRALRFFNVFGPGQLPDSQYAGVISLFFDRAMKEEPLRIFGDGLQTRDFVFVKDVCRFILAAMDSDAPGFSVHNVCTGRTTTVLDLAHQILETCGADVPIEHMPPREDDIRHSAGSSAAAEAALGIRAETPLSDGLAALHESLVAAR
ncbi:MAG: epimerase [Rhodospirillaceae bacterium]|nr:epimerase [Rhodospirillaceae bacterium]|tara:strand:- start:1015 stop:1938 length:924 start_codon:yes stop_codon:yes gene_type:complete